MSSDIDQKELELVHKLRNRVSDAIPKEKLQDDHYLHRWLVGREFNLEKAERMLRNHKSWAIRNEIDSILEWKPPLNYFRYAFLGHDHDGNPVYIFPVGIYDLLEILHMGDVIPAGRTALRLLQRLELEIIRAAEQFKKPGRQAIVILDFQKFSYRQVNNKSSVQCAMEFFAIFIANYPELLKTIILINTPKIFPLAFAIIKPFISARGMKKIEFCGNNRDKWAEILLEKFPQEILPPYYGGSRPGNDEYCSDDTSLWNDEPLPEKFYDIGYILRNSRISLISENNKGVWVKNEILAGSVLELVFSMTLEMIEAGVQLLKWKIQSEGYDIGLRVTFKSESSESDVRDLVDFHRINAHLKVDEGSLLCELPGIYTLMLDNSYSKRRKKIVSHNVYLSEN